jgi:hypothetical protein
MALYELRTYTLHVGKMAEAVKLYQEIGFPALQKGGQDKKLIGYFQSDTGTTINFYTSGNSMMTPIGERIGQVCRQTECQAGIACSGLSTCARCQCLLRATP